MGRIYLAVQLLLIPIGIALIIIASVGSIHRWEVITLAVVMVIQQYRLIIASGRIAIMYGEIARLHRRRLPGTSSNGHNEK